MPRHSGQIQILQQVTNDVVGVGDTMTEAHQTQVLGDGQCGEEGLLSQVGGNGGALSARAGVRDVPKNPNLTSKRVQEPAACAQDRRLPRPIDPDQGKDLTRQQVEGRRSADRLIAVADTEIVGAHQGLGRRLRAPGPTHRGHLPKGGTGHVVNGIGPRYGSGGAARAETRCSGH